MTGFSRIQYFDSVTDSEDNPPVLFCASPGDEELTVKFAGLEVEFVIAASTDSEDNPPVLFCASPGRRINCQICRT